MNKAQETQSQLQLDKSRVTLLLQINAELLKEVMVIQPNMKLNEDSGKAEFKEYEFFSAARRCAKSGC